MALLVKKFGWTEWLCKSNFSFLVGSSHPSELIDRASSLSYNALSLNDYDGVYGSARIHHERQAMIDSERDCNPSKLIHGAELHLTTDHDQPVIFQDTLVLIAHNLTGYQNLCALLSYAHRDGKKHPNVPLNYLVERNLTGLSCIKPMRGHVRIHRSEADHQAQIALLRECFKSNLYLAVSRHLSQSEDHWIESTYKTAKFFGCKLLPSQDAFFHNPQAKDLSDLLHAIRHNKTVHEVPEQLFVNARRSLGSLEYIERVYSQLPQFLKLLRDSKDLADSCTFDLNELTYKYPDEMVPDGLDSDDYLQKITWESANIAYPSSVPESVIKQLKHELKLVIEMGFSDYFLTVYDIVNWARRQNILCQGRGSAANSAICYVLGITSVDPSNYELLFERFINKERKDPPDIDIDFEHERREEVLQYVYERYGRERAAMVANVICYRSKGTLRASGEAIGIPSQAVSRASKIISTKEFRSKGIAETIRCCQRRSANHPILQTDHWKLWIEMAGTTQGISKAPRDTQRWDSSSHLTS